MATANSVLKIAAGEIGYNRWNDPNPGTKYGRWYAELTKSPYFGQSGVPYCAMFVAWCLAQAGQSCSGMPTAAVVTAYNGAKNAGLVRANKQDAQPGDLVCFNWGDGGSAYDHIGFVEKNCGTYIQTIEGNTTSGMSGSQGNGGGVYRRTRNWGVVQAIIRVPYDGQATPAPTPSAPSTSTTTTTSTKLAVDGQVGPATVREWQRQRGTTVDGVISGQSTSDKAAHQNINAIQYGSGGSQLVRSVQSFLTARGYKVTADGYLGKKTVTAIQQWMRDKLGYTKHAIDGICGPNTAANIQNALNAGAFRG